MLPVATTVPVTYLVSASRAYGKHFYRATYLGRSLSQFPKELRPRLFIRTENHGPSAEGLASFYNRAIEELPDEGQVVFLHDDLYLHDWFLAERLREAFCHFDVVGLVGCVDPGDDQPSATHTLDGGLVKARCAGRRLSGVLNHFDAQRIEPDVFGPAPQACGLLDGCFLACRLEMLNRMQLRFDSQFAFHCYDADFCRSARDLGLKLGTWPIACTHGSPGDFSLSWQEAALQFRRKWCATTSSA